MAIRQKIETQSLDYGWERILVFYKAKLENELQKQYVNIIYEQAKVKMEASSKTKIKEAYELLNKQIDKLEIKLISDSYPANIYQEFCREYNSDLKSTFEIQTPYAVVQGNDLYKWAKQLKDEKGYDLAFNQIVSKYFPDEKNTENKLFSICKKSQTERLKEYCLDIIELLHQSQENNWTPLHTDQINPEYLKDLQYQYEKYPQDNLNCESLNELRFSKISEVSNEQEGVKVLSKMNQSKIFSQSSLLQQSIIQNSEIRDELKQSVLQ
ncbi:hypothetical protein PPERSA_11200 [Pseudocohnilembus persalinus]|uniref:Uncharacterized protein n=1 Tax=Pseudocohnilembus persalinus TaxID=266149 RepID=A0A0V0QZB9_PSEPJ|nr:hypothetical protein PPERSA_11200 [Pseudocohnilembus persalinus]|eukprot:KRX07651.1 hypothetical protein PPERSA_11200 [Pseudocohnilembus persalinus]